MTSDDPNLSPSPPPLFFCFGCFLKGNLDISSLSEFECTYFLRHSNKNWWKIYTIAAHDFGELDLLPQTGPPLSQSSKFETPNVGRQHEISCILAMASITRLHAQLHIISSIDLNLF